jgi:hypothetical protein
MAGFTFKAPNSVKLSGEAGSGLVTSFNELTVAELTPIAQGDFVYNINTKVFETLTFAGGSVSQSDGMGIVNSSTSSSGSAALELRRAIKYQDGQGALFRGTALFTTGTAGNIQIIGLGNGECGYFFGYLNQNFGILHQATSKREIRMLTVSVGAGTENVTVTLDGKSIVVPVVGASDTSRTSYGLSTANYTSVGDGWYADVIDSKVYFLSARAGPYTGSFSAVGSSAGSLGTFTRVRAGVSPASTFITQSAWNLDPLDGTGPSRMILDKQMGNVYQIGFQYLGFGNAFFSVEDPETGRVVPVHMIKNANSRTTPVLSNPNVSALVSSTNIPGGAGIDVPVRCGSMAGFIEGKRIRLDPKYAFSDRFSFPDTSNAWRCFLAMKVDRVFNGQSCFGEWDLIRMSATNETGGVAPKSCTIGIFLDTTITGDLDFQSISQGQSIVSYSRIPDASISATTFTPDSSPVFTVGVNGGNSLDIDLSDLNFSFGPGRVVVFAVRSDDAIAGNFAINWHEQQ